MQQVLDKHKAQNFELVTINVLNNQDKGAVQIMSNYTFTALKNPGGEFQWATKNYGVRGTPTSFLLDGDGKILFKFNGLESLDATDTCNSEVGGLLAFSATTTNAVSARATAKAPPQ